MMKNNLFLTIALLSIGTFTCYGSEHGDSFYWANIDSILNDEYLEEDELQEENDNNFTISDRLKEARPQDHNLMNLNSLKKELQAMEYRKKHGAYKKISLNSLNALQQKVIEYNIDRLSKQSSNKKTKSTSQWLEVDKNGFLKI